MELPGGGDTWRSQVSNQPSYIPRMKKNVVKTAASSSKPKQSDARKVSEKSAAVTTQHQVKSSFSPRRAISLENLAPEKTKSQPSKEIMHRKRAPVQTNKSDLIAAPDFAQRSAQRICQVLYLNSWRKGRIRVNDLKNGLTQTEHRVTDLITQNRVLLQLLSLERDRITQAASEKKVKSEILKRYQQELAVLAQDKNARSSTCIELERLIGIAEDKFENEMVQTNRLTEHINEIKLHLTDVGTNLTRVVAAMAILQDAETKSQEDEVTRNKMMAIEKEKLTVLTRETWKTCKLLSVSNKKLVSFELTITRLYFENASKLKNFSDACDQNQVLFGQLKIMEAAARTNDAQLVAKGKEIEEKIDETAKLVQQLNEIEILEASWRYKAHTFITQLQPLVLYILTQRIN